MCCRWHQVRFSPARVGSIPYMFFCTNSIVSVMLNNDIIQSLDCLNRVLTSKIKFAEKSSVRFIYTPRQRKHRKTARFRQFFELQHFFSRPAENGLGRVWRHYPASTKLPPAARAAASGGSAWRQRVTRKKTSAYCVLLTAAAVVWSIVVGCWPWLDR